MKQVNVKTERGAMRALKAGKPIRIVAGTFSFAVTGLAVDIDVAPEADIDISLTNCGTIYERAVLRGSSSAVLRGSSSAVLWGSSSAVLWGSSSAVLWGSSSAVLWESSSAVLWESSSAVLWESSSADAWGYSMLRVKSPNTTPKAADTVAVNLWNGAKCEGGRQQVVSLKTAEDWCNFYGAKTENGEAIVYKAVGADYRSNWGVKYTPGTEPKDPQWDGKKRECSQGGGLNFSPTPRHTHRFVDSPKHYLECRIKLDEMVVHFDGRFPEKVCARRVCGPLIEVDVDGERISS